MTRKTIGIDYSLTTPAICVCNGDFGFKNCKFYYLTNVNKYSGDWIKEDTLGVRQEGKFNHWLINADYIYPIPPKYNDTTKFPIGRLILLVILLTIFL